MSTFSFGSRGWGSSPHIKLTFIPEVSHYPTSSSDPIIYVIHSWTVNWGDGTVVSGASTSGGSGDGINITHDYGSNVGPRTITVSTSTDSVSEFRITGAGLTSISATLIPVLTSCATFDFSNNFLTTLPDLSVGDDIVTFLANYNNLRGAFPQFSTIARLNTINFAHNGYDTLDDLAQYGALLSVDVSYNPMVNYLGTTLPPFISTFHVQHCQFGSAMVDLFGAQLEANLSSANKIVVTQTGSVGSGGTLVDWIDRDYTTLPTKMHFRLPFDATDWPDPDIIGPYVIFTHNSPGTLDWEYLPNALQKITVTSKFGGILTCEMQWINGQESAWAISNSNGNIQSWRPGNASPVFWNPPNGTEVWNAGSFSHVHTLFRSHQFEGGENGVPSSAAQTSLNNVRAAASWVTTGVTPIYNDVNQNSGHARVVAQRGGGGVDYARIGWMGKRYKSGTSDADTPDMRTVRFAHIMGGIAATRRALVGVWYAGLGTMSGDHIDSITLNGTNVPRIGPTIHETNPPAGPYNFETFMSDILEQQNMMELVLHLDAAAGEMAFCIGFVRDVGDVRYTDRPIGDTDPVVGRTDWATFTSVDDMIVVYAGSRMAGDTAVTIHNDGQFRNVPVGNGNDVADPWITYDQNPSLAGNTLLWKQGVRPEGTNNSTSNWYWTKNVALADWTTVGGAARAFVFGQKLGNRVRAFLLD